MKEVTYFTYSSDEFDKFRVRLEELFESKYYVAVNAFSCSNRVVLAFENIEKTSNETSVETVFVEYVSP